MKIKFRAWDEKLKAMAKVISLSFYEEDSPHSGGETESFLYYEKLDTTSLRSFVDIELMQYTDLKDSNGVDIYEGDIVRVIHAEYFIDKICTVVWGHDNNDSYPAFHMPELDTESNSFSEVFNVDGYFVKVIGNIYQNKELLEGE